MDILQEIIRMDRAAAERADLMYSAELKRIEAAEAKSERRFEKAVANEKAQADAFRSEREERLALKKADTEKAMLRQIAQLDGIFSQHKEQWQSEIIGRITGT